MWGWGQRQVRGLLGCRLWHQIPWVSTHLLPPAIRVDLSKALRISVTRFPYPPNNTSSVMLAVWWLLRWREENMVLSHPEERMERRVFQNRCQGARGHTRRSTWSLAVEWRQIWKNKHNLIHFKTMVFQGERQREGKNAYVFFKAAFTHVYFPCVCPLQEFTRHEKSSWKASLTNLLARPWCRHAFMWRSISVALASGIERNTWQASRSSLSL